MHPIELNTEAKNFISKRESLQQELLNHQTQWESLLKNIPTWIQDAVGDLKDVDVKAEGGSVILTFGSSLGLSLGLSDPSLKLTGALNGNVYVSYAYQVFYDPHDVFKATPEPIECIPAASLDKNTVLGIVAKFVKSVSNRLDTVSTEQPLLHRYELLKKRRKALQHLDAVDSKKQSDELRKLLRKSGIDLTPTVDQQRREIEEEEASIIVAALAEMGGMAPQPQRDLVDDVMELYKAWKGV